MWYFENKQPVPLLKCFAALTLGSSRGAFSTFSRSLATLIWQPKCLVGNKCSALSSAPLETGKDRQCPTSIYVNLEPSLWGEKWAFGSEHGSFPLTNH